MNLSDAEKKAVVSAEAQLPDDFVFGLDIGTRSIVGTVGYRQPDGHFVVVAQAATPPCADALHPPVRKVQRRVEPRTENRLVHPYLVARKQRGRHRVRRDDERVGHQGAPTVVHGHAQHDGQPDEAHAARHLIRHAPYRLHRPPSVSLRRTQTITAKPANTQTP